MRSSNHRGREPAFTYKHNHITYYIYQSLLRLLQLGHYQYAELIIDPTYMDVYSDIEMRKRN